MKRDPSGTIGTFPTLKLSKSKDINLIENSRPTFLANSESKTTPPLLDKIVNSTSDNVLVKESPAKTAKTAPRFRLGPSVRVNVDGQMIQRNFHDTSVLTALESEQRILQFEAEKLEEDVSRLKKTAEIGVGSDAEKFLRRSAKLGSVQDIKFALALSVNVNAQSRNGWTALMFACKFNHERVVQVLLAHPMCNVNLSSK